MNDYLNVCMYECIVGWMYGWINICMYGWMFTVVVSLVLEDKLGERKEPLRLRRDILFCPMVADNLPRLSNSQDSRLSLPMNSKIMSC